MRRKAQNPESLVPFSEFLLQLIKTHYNFAFFLCTLDMIISSFYVLKCIFHKWMRVHAHAYCYSVVVLSSSFDCDLTIPIAPFTLATYNKRQTQNDA